MKRYALENVLRSGVPHRAMVERIDGPWARWDDVEFKVAEVGMLRGEGCLVDGDGPCGACIKCASARADGLAANVAQAAEDVLALSLAGLKFEEQRDGLTVALREIEQLSGTMRAAGAGDDVQVAREAIAKYGEKL